MSKKNSSDINTKLQGQLFAQHAATMMGDELQQKKVMLVITNKPKPEPQPLPELNEIVRVVCSCSQCELPLFLVITSAIVAGLVIYYVTLCNLPRVNGNYSCGMCGPRGVHAISI